MRTCPKEEETVETCDGMNQKNLYLIKVISENLKTSKITKRKINDYWNWYEKKIDLSMLFHAFNSFPKG